MFAYILINGFHYIAFAIGFAALVHYSRWLKKSHESIDVAHSLKRFRVIHMFVMLGLILSLLTGFYKLLGTMDKGVAYYMKHGLFHAKLGLVFLILIIECVQWCIFASWKKIYHSTEPLKLSKSKIKLSKILHMIAMHAYVLIPFLATAVAKGYGI